MVQDLALLTAKNGRPYAKFKMSDKTGSIEAMLFEYDPEPAHTLKDGEVFFLSGKMDSYNGKIQCKPTNSITKMDVFELNDFTKATKYDIEEMWSKLVNYIATFEHHNLKAVAEDIMLRNEWAPLFKRCPAATGMHHAFIGGLLEHTLEMVEIGDLLLKQSCFKGKVDRDLSLFGLMFHDFGKIFEYSPEAGFKKIESGILVGHIPMVSAAVYHSCAMLGVPDEERNHMMHVILAHHGQIIWGSPVEMATPEAAFVHYIDNMHATVFGFLQRIEDNPGREFVKHGYANNTIVARRFNEQQASI